VEKEKLKKKEKEKERVNPKLQKHPILQAINQPPKLILQLILQIIPKMLQLVLDKYLYHKCPYFILLLKTVSKRLILK